MARMVKAMIHNVDNKANREGKCNENVCKVLTKAKSPTTTTEGSLLYFSTKTESFALVKVKVSPVSHLFSRTLTLY